MEENARKGSMTSTRAPALVSVIAEAENGGNLDFWTAVYNSKAIFIVVILLYLFCGTVFYKLYDRMNWSEAYYFSVNTGFRIGYSTPTSDIDNFSKIFTFFFKFAGVCILAFFYTVLLRSSYFQRADVRLTRLLTSLLVATVSLVIGALWSYLAIGWSFVNGLYFVFSTCFWWGSYSVPTNSSSGTLVMTATLALVGGLAVFVFFAFLAATIEVYIENRLLNQASKQAMTSTEMGIVEKLLTIEKQRRDNAAQQDPLKQDGKEHESEEEQLYHDEEGEDEQLLMPETQMLLSKEVVEHLLLIRVLALEDVSIVYYYVRLWLIAAFALCLVFGMFFYKFYDGSEFWCLALNYSVSSFYRLGYSNSDVDSFSQIVSTLIMLIGCVLFNLLNVCITREFGLKARDIRYFHTLMDGLLCLIFCCLIIAMFLDTYSWTGVQSFVFATDVMMGYGDNVPSNESIWSYWMLDFYTIVIIPLFVAYVSHVEVELDVGDALGYMNRALSLSFDRHDLRLVQIHDDYVDKRYAAIGVGERGESSKSVRSRSSSIGSELSFYEEEDLVLSRNEFGTYELHVLLVLRLKDFVKDKMREMVLDVNRSYNKARAENLEVFHCHNDDDLRIVDLSNELEGSFRGGSFSDRSHSRSQKRSGSPGQRRRSSRPKMDSDVESQASTRD